MPVPLQLMPSETPADTEGLMRVVGLSGLFEEAEHWEDFNFLY